MPTTSSAAADLKRGVARFRKEVPMCAPNEHIPSTTVVEFRVQRDELGRMHDEMHVTTWTEAQIEKWIEDGDVLTVLCVRCRAPLEYRDPARRPHVYPLLAELRSRERVPGRGRELEDSPLGGGPPSDGRDRASSGRTPLGR